LSEERVERRLAAILAADVAGYSRLMGEDEAGTLACLRTHRRELIDPKVADHKGRIVKTTGDGFLVEFASVVDALRCATEWQRGMAEHNANAPDDRIEFRMGITVGDVVVEGDDIFGDGVNVAARLEALADPGGICVSARVQEDASGRLDLRFDDLGEQSLKNIARRVRVYRVRVAALESKPTTSLTDTAAVLALPDKPSIAVLPFRNMSGDPEQEYFVDGMVEEIITALSHIRWLFVIARNSSFTYKGQPVDVKQVGRELGVRYVLEGSMRRSGNRVRITAQLIEAATNAHLWADRFDRSIDDIFVLQDDVATSVAGVIEPALLTAEMRRAIVRPTTDLNAYDFYLRALATFYPETRERLYSALILLQRATAIDAHYGPALSWAAICHMRLVFDGWAEQPQTNRTTAIELARKALEVGENDPGILVHSAFVLANFGEDIGAMRGLVDRALMLNPSFARGWYISGLLRQYAGEHDVAIEHVKTSLRLSPHDRMGSPFNVIGVSYFFKRVFDKAVNNFLLTIQDQPGYPSSYRYLAACYAQLGYLDEARATIARLRTITHQVMPSVVPWRRADDRELFLSGMRIATGDTVD